VATAICLRDGSTHIRSSHRHSWIPSMGRGGEANQVKPTMVLLCKVCRWRLPGDQTMGVVAAHFETEPEHDPEDVKLEMVGWCPRCDRELTLDRIEEGLMRTIHYVCPQCHGSGFVFQRAGGRDE